LFMAMARSEGIRVPLFPSAHDSGECFHGSQVCAPAAPVTKT
jgi:hypothetical protein